MFRRTLDNSSHLPQDKSEQLARLIAQACQAQRLLSAPDSLQARVMAAIRCRSSLPWWHKSFVHWPTAVRAVFLVGCLIVAQLMLVVMARLNIQPYTTQLVSSVTETVSWLHSIGRLVSLLRYSAALAIERVPVLWLYGGTMGIVTVYAVVFGLAAAAYRTLSVGR